MVKKIFKENENTTSKFKEVASVCKKYGYILDEDSAINVSGNVEILELYITPNGSTRYAPDIYRNVESRENRRALTNVKFKIATASYGSLTKDEYVEFLNACENAYKLVEYLETVDFSDFPRDILD